MRLGLLATIAKFDDADLDYTAFPGAYTVRQLMLHIAHEELIEIQHGVTRQLSEFPPAYPDKAFPTVASVKELLPTVHAPTLRYLEGLPPGEIDGEIEAGWGGIYSPRGMLWHVLEHELHHRGELSFILGLLGKLGLDA